VTTGWPRKGKRNSNDDDDGDDDGRQIGEGGWIL